MKEKEFNRDEDLKQQHLNYLKSNDKAHNRRSGLISMTTLKERRYRRRWHVRLKETVVNWNQKYNESA